jgi:hypothetical protein
MTSLAAFYLCHLEVVAAGQQEERKSVSRLLHLKK